VTAPQPPAAIRPGSDYRFPGPGERAFVFAGSTCILGTSEPWYSLGEVTARILAPLGYQVQILCETAGPINPRFVADGRAEAGATNPSIAENAFSATRAFASEGKRDHLRAIACICRPSWMAIAVTQESGITDLAQIKERRQTVRMFVGSQTVLDYYGLTREEIVSYGGSISTERGGRDLDVIFGPLYLANTPAALRWLQAVTCLNLRYLDIPEGLIQRFLEEGEEERGVIPHGYVPGLDHDVQTVARPYLVIYTREDAPDDLVRTLAQGYDEHRNYFLETHVNFSYDPEHAARHTRIPLHPAALAYYKERGYPTA
jgi:TRAP-type uncharacterized transport system substrate-binding protein